MTIGTWTNPSTLKNSIRWNIKKILANRPKGISDADWNSYIAEEKINKLLILNKAPKEKRVSAPKKSSNDEG
jgi:hypothetical protein